MTDEELLQFIADLMKKKETAGKAPFDQVTFVELLREAAIPTKDLKSSLNRLFLSKNIIVGNTMNDKYIKITEP